MLGSISSELLPTDDSGTPGSPALSARAPRPAAARHEPAAAPPLLRGRGAALVDAGLAGRELSPAAHELAYADGDLEWEAAGDAEAVEVVVGQLAPIRSHASLSSSYAREANPDDPVIRAAYSCVWADLAMSMAMGTTRRARRRATLAEPRRTPLRGRG
jgi:hypothetical protein